MTAEHDSATPAESTPWRYTRVGSILLSLDLIISLPVGAALAVVVYASHAVQASVRGAFLFIAPAGLALGGIMLAAGSILPGLMDTSYRLLIDRAPGGISAVTRPFKILGIIAFSTALSGLIVFVVWPAAAGAESWVLATIAGLPLFLFVWTVLGAVQLISQSMFHFESKTKLERAVTIVKDRHKAAS